MLFTSAHKALRTPYFFLQAAISFVLNGMFNGLIAWGTFSSSGKVADPALFPGIPVWSWSTKINSCGAMDVLLTTFAMGFFTVLLGSAGIRKDARKSGQVR